MGQFRRQVPLSENPHEYQVRVAKMFGAWEVYDYLLTMSEEDLANDELETLREQDSR